MDKTMQQNVSGDFEFELEQHGYGWGYYERWIYEYVG